MDTDVRISWVHSPPSPEAALSLLTPPVGDWFRRRYGTPTLPQRLAWPVLSGGENLLLSAPTGSGKTLAAMLPIASALVTDEPADAIRCVYLAPLRALCNELAVRLPQILQAIAVRQPAVALRTGDTTGYRRRRLLESPPEILITTPESLALLLSRADADRLFGEIRWVVVDEVHSLAATKRGADLAISFERLSAIACREPQRIGLSATCEPLDEAAKWLSGTGRSISIAAAADERPMELRLHYITPDSGRFHVAVVEHVLSVAAENRTTLVFANSRGLAERLVWLLRQRRPHWSNQIAAHHASLAAETRQDIERQMQAGRMWIVVTSTSLELGIDIGSVDPVVMIRPPGGTVRLLQRLGRAGHGPGRLRRGTIIATTVAEVLEGAVTSAASESGQLESLAVPDGPLDVLCQQLVGMSCQRSWPAAGAWDRIRRAYPYRRLSLRDFADCLDYLSGGKASAGYVPRFQWQDHVFSARDKLTTRIYRQNVGTIASEPIREVRLQDGTLVGTVNDWFADELQPGDRFLLSGRAYEVTAANADALEVSESLGMPWATGWEGGLWPAPQALAARMWAFRARAKDCLLDGPAALRRLFTAEYRLDGEAAEALAEYFEEQEAVSEIPTRGLLVEVCPARSDGGWLCCLHLPLALPACDALGRLLAWRLGQGSHVQTRADCMLATLTIAESVELDSALLRRLLIPAGFLHDLERALSQSSLLRRRFQAAAETGLLVLRQPLGRRRRVGGRDWAARRLFNWLRFADPDSPLLKQATREAHQDWCDATTVASYLAQLASENIVVRHLAEPSPFAATALEPRPGEHEDLHLDPRALGAPAASVVIHRDWALTPFRAALHLPSFTAVIADVHLGYDAARRGGGEAIPSFGVGGIQRRLRALFAAHPVRRLVVAGDLVEDARFLDGVRELIGWVRGQGVDFLLVPGNHDRDLPAMAELNCQRGGFRLGDWLISHEENAEHKGPHVIGHVHPMVRLPKPTPCYLVGPRRIILPAFSDDAAGGNVREWRGWRKEQCFAIVGDTVRHVSPASRERQRPEVIHRSLTLPARRAIPARSL